MNKQYRMNFRYCGSANGLLHVDGSGCGNEDGNGYGNGYGNGEGYRSKKGSGAGSYFTGGDNFCCGRGTGRSFDYENDVAIASM